MRQQLYFNTKQAPGNDRLVWSLWTHGKIDLGIATYTIWYESEHKPLRGTNTCKINGHHEIQLTSMRQVVQECVFHLLTKLVYK